MRTRRAPYSISIGEKAWTWRSGKCAFDRDQQVTVLKGWHIGVDAALHADFRGAARDRVGHLGQNLLVGMIIGIGLPFLAFKAAELASDETNIREIDIPIDDVGYFVADVLGTGQVGAFDQRTQIRTLGAVEQQTFVRRQLLAVKPAHQIRRGPARIPDPSNWIVRHRRFRQHNYAIDRGSRLNLRLDSIVETVNRRPYGRIDPLIVDVFGVNREPLF